MVRAGKLRRRIAIQTNTPTVDGAGQKIASWSTDRTENGYILEKGGGETIRGEQVQEFVDIVAAIRYPRAGTFPTSEMRIQYTDGASTRTFNIELVQRRDNFNHELWLYCSEDLEA